MLDEGLHESKVAAEGGKVDGGTPLLVLEGGVGSSLEENLSTLLKSISNLRYNNTCTQTEVIIFLQQESHQRAIVLFLYLICPTHVY